MNSRTYFAILLVTVTAALLAQAPATKTTATAGSPRDLVLNVGKSLVLESPEDIQRVSVASGDILELVAVGPREVVINGKGVGESSLILWQSGGNRLMFDVSVRKPNLKQEALKREIAKELGDQGVSANLENEAVYLRGTVKDLNSAERAVAIAEAFGRPVNLLRVATPPGEAQILLRVKFAEIDRSNSSDIGVNLFSTGATNTIGAITTQQYSPPSLAGSAGNAAATISDALNIFLFRRDLNLGATIKLLESKQILQVLAEPNLLTTSGKQASFNAGGEFPYPILQASGGTPVVTITFREFGIKLNFTPTVTPRGTIHLLVAPEVSALDYSNNLVYAGFNVPALSSRKVSTEIELENGQTFGIAGLLDNETQETLSKVPGLGDIPFFGKLFQSRAVKKSKKELLVVVTPEIVRPVPEGQPIPDVALATPVLQDGPKTAPRTPGVDVTGPVPVKPAVSSVPVEDLLHPEKSSPAVQAPTMYQLVPMPAAPAVPGAPPAPATSQSPPKQ